MGEGGWQKCRELKMSCGSQGTTSSLGDRPWATSAPAPFTCSPLPWQINVLQAKKKFEILDSVSDW